MGSLHRPRWGSLQFWPRSKAKKEVPSVNWKAHSNAQAKNKLLGFICYKVGMKSALVKDNTPNSMTKGKSIVLPVTIFECPPLKVYSIRLYKNGQVVSEIISSSLEKELKRKIIMPKNIKSNEKDFDDVNVLVYSIVKKTGIKKTPNMCELGLKGNPQEKLEFAKSILNREINFDEFFDKNQNVDSHAVTKGKGFSGPVKRFGITYRPHKSEKGVKKVGSIGPWHPARVTFRVAMAGQMGYFTRVQYNNKIIAMGKDMKDDFQHYGKIKTNYALIKGSIQGPAKRAVVLASALRPTKKLAKENFEFVKIL
jgi:large subunit ribosomal protein L3